MSESQVTGADIETHLKKIIIGKVISHRNFGDFLPDIVHISVVQLLLEESFAH